jgi:hypothetical protein
VRIAQEMLRDARQMGYGGVQGVQVSAPFGRYTVAAEVIAEVLPTRAAAAESAPASRAVPVEGLHVGNV